MAKKLTLLAAMLAIAALGAPATAAAGLLPIGTTMRLVSMNMAIETELGALTCAEVQFEGEIEENGGKLFIEELVGTTKKCLLNGKNAITIEPITLNDTFTEGKGGAVKEGSVDISLIASLPGGIKCNFEGEGEGFFKFALHTTTTTFMDALNGGVCGEAFFEANTNDFYKNELGEWKPAEWI
jgi:hypothetical protein